MKKQRKSRVDVIALRASRIISEALQCSVVLHDDGSQSSMYDLRIGSVDAPETAIECVSATDPVSTETWNIGPAKGPLHLSVQGNWIVVLKPNTNIKQLKLHIESLLQNLEARGIGSTYVDFRLQWQEESLFECLEDLGISHLIRSSPTGEGKVHLTMEGRGGAVDENGLSIPEWIGDFLRHNDRKDVIHKLAISRARSCHVFIYVSSDGAPWSVESYLTGHLNYVPSSQPNLPEPVSEVWIASSLNSKGVRWNQREWVLFDTRGDGIDSAKG